MKRAEQTLPALHTTGSFPPLALQNHELRMTEVIKRLLNHGSRSVIDLGSGEGALLRRIINSTVELDSYLGIEPWTDRVERAKTAELPRAFPIDFIEGSMTKLPSLIKNVTEYTSFGAVILLETIEHVPLTEVEKIEEGVFGHITPPLVVVTTPDATSRLTEAQLKDRGHHFEWDIKEFSGWASAIERLYPYSATIKQLTGPTFVRNTQIATFTRAS